MDIKVFCPEPIPPGTATPVQRVGQRAAEAAAGAAETEVPRGTRAAGRLLELRRRIRARVYDSPEVIDEVVRRMVESGDL